MPNSNVFKMTGERFNWIRMGRTRKMVIPLTYGTGSVLGPAIVTNVDHDGMQISIHITRNTYTTIEDLSTEDVRDTGFRDLGQVLDALDFAEPGIPPETMVLLVSFVRTDVKDG